MDAQLIGALYGQEEMLYDAFKGQLPGQEDEVSALGYILVVMASSLNGCSIDRSTL
jgi:hypothetical protein